MKNTSKAFELYKIMMRDGEMPEEGLCSIVRELRKEYKDKLLIFYPLPGESRRDFFYWLAEYPYRISYTFNPLRQTVFCFLMVMNGDI